MSSQLPLPLPTQTRLGRADFMVSPGNSAAVTLIDRWPDWPSPAAALFGPSGSGKTHLGGIWAERAGATILAAAELCDAILATTTPLLIEDVDREPLGLERERVLFALLERGQAMVLTALQPPSAWRYEIPDLQSRYAALLTFTLWEPDDVLLEGLAKKLFADRQLKVPDSVIAQMIRALERSPAAVRDFVARADALALAEKRAVTLPLIRELLA